MDISELPIVDCHHHLWDLDTNYYPWLSDKITKRVCGDYAAIRKNYLLDDFWADIGSLNVVKTVHVQAEHDYSDPVRETRWLESVAKRTPERSVPAGIVAWADLASPKLNKILEGHLQSAAVRGIRQMCHEAYIDPATAAAKPAPLKNPAWLGGLSSLVEFNLSFDLQFYYQQVEEAYQAVASNPEVQFVIVHAGQPAERSDTALHCWRSALKRMAELPNTSIKISGLGMFDREWTAASLRPIILSVIDVFGTQRCLFGSNFPVDGMMSDYRRLWSAYYDAVAAFSIDEKLDLFGRNAERVYRI